VAERVGPPLGRRLGQLARIARLLRGRRGKRRS
jgi:hypothetical protein